MRTLIAFVLIWAGASVAIAEDYQLLLFTAQWCGHCKPMHARLHERQVTDKLLKMNAVRIVIDIDEHPELAKSYDVKSVPELIFVRLNKERKGDVIQRKTGKLTTEEILEVATVLTAEQQPAQNSKHPSAE